MKWYSIKKYNPPHDTRLIVIGIKDNIPYYMQAKTAGYDQYYDFIEWKFYPETEDKIEVTHFLVPEPVEIDK